MELSSSLVDEVYAATREAILSGAYPPGSPLRLGAIAQENGVSFIPVREAMRRLESERLVEFRTNKGARVSHLSVGEMQDIYETRIAIEQHALRLALPHLGEGELAVAERKLAEMTRLFRRGKDSDAHRVHRDFHFALYTPCGSQWLMHIVGLLWDNAERYVRQSPHVRASVDDFASEHERILVAVRLGDPVAASTALEEHLRRTEDLLTVAYGDLEPARD